MNQILPAEFDLHIWKRPGVDGRPDLFNIGAWDGLLTIRSLGHILPIDEAMTILRQILENAGSTVAQDSTSEVTHGPRARPSSR